MGLKIGETVELGRGYRGVGRFEGARPVEVTSWHARRSAERPAEAGLAP
jgi:hypothetical protein